MADKEYCPRGSGPDSPHNPPFNGEMTWTKGRCSYCGSMEPEAFLEAIEAGSEVIPTDKSYKAYVRGGATGQQKFYFQHLSAEQQQRFINLYNENKMKLAVPGHFYVMPYFCSPRAQGEAA